MAEAEAEAAKKVDKAYHKFQQFIREIAAITE